MLRSNERILYGSLILSSILIVLVQRKYLPYHFAPFFMLLLPLAAVGIFAIATSFARPAARGLTIGLGCLLCSFGGYYPENAAIFVRAALAGQDPFEKMYAAYHSYPKFGASQEHDVIHYLNLPENRAGCVELFSYSPELRLHLDRQFAGPYIMPTAIAVRADDGLSDHPVYTKYQLKWQREYMDTLRAAKPRFLIFAQHTQFWNLVDPYESWLRFMPGFDSLLESDYQYDTSFGWYKIWRRRS